MVSAVNPLSLREGPPRYPADNAVVRPRACRYMTGAVAPPGPPVPTCRRRGAVPIRHCTPPCGGAAAVMTRAAISSS